MAVYLISYVLWIVWLNSYSSQHEDLRPNALGYVKSRRSHAAVIRVYDEAGNMIETHEHAGEFKEP